MDLEQLEPFVYLPCFTGSNPARWLCEIERFFSFYAIYEEERFPYVVEFFDDEPFYWFNSWYRGTEHLTWKSFTTAVLTTFSPIPKTPPTTTSKHPSYVVTSAPKTAHTLVPKQAPKPTSYNTPRCHQAATTNAFSCTKNGTHNNRNNTRVKPLNKEPKAAGRRDWRPPWRAVETAPNVVGRVEWRPPW